MGDDVQHFFIASIYLFMNHNKKYIFDAFAIRLSMFKVFCHLS